MLKFILELIVIQTKKQQISGKYFPKFCLNLPQNGQFDFNFWKSKNKNDKCGNLWQKIYMCALRETNLFFILAL